MDVFEQFFDSVVVFMKESNLTRGKRGHELGLERLEIVYMNQGNMARKGGWERDRNKEYIYRDETRISKPKAKIPFYIFALSSPSSSLLLPLFSAFMYCTCEASSSLSLFLCCPLCLLRRVGMYDIGTLCK